MVQPHKNIVLRLKIYNKYFLCCRADLNNTKFFIGIEIPFLLFNAQYDMNARVLVIPVKGKGPITANASE